MKPKFNIDRPKISDDEINKHKDFDKLVKQFKEQSINKARSDNSWWKNNYIRYAAVIAGATVICTVTYKALFNTPKTSTDDKTTTLSQNKTTNKVPVSTKFINEPFTKLKVNYTTYKVDNSKGANLKHHTNSKIKIPKNTFVNKKGEEITGEVEIMYREFHDQADIITSGIPMTYDSAGIKSTFESAGMFDIQGSQNGEPVFMKQGKAVTVEFASTQTEDHFNQYFLDTVAKNWKYLKRDNPVEFIADKKTETNPKEALKKLEEKYQPAINIIPKRIDSVKVVYTKKIEKLEKPVQPVKPNKSSGRPQFELEVDYKDYPELEAFKNAVFEIGAENTNYKPEMKDVTWSSAEIEEGPQKGKNYILVLKLRQRTEKLIVYPVLSINDYEVASKKYEQKFEKYKVLQTKRQADEEKLKAEMEAKQAGYLAIQKNLQEAFVREKVRIQQEMTTSLNTQIKSGGIVSVISRVFDISNFGIYNSDCGRPSPSGQVINPVFVLSADGKPIFPNTLYIIESGRNIVFAYNQANMNTINIDPKLTYSACLLIGPNVYSISREEFSKVVMANGNSFKVNKLGTDITDLFELKKAMGLTS